MNKRDIIGEGQISEEQRKKYLRNKLKRYIYDQKEMDVEEVRETVAKLNEIEPEEPLSQFEKKDMWKKIQAMAKAENTEVTENNKRKKKRRYNFRRMAVGAAAVVAAVFLGANIGTYATARMNVFQYMGEVKNGTSFWVSGDTPTMEKEIQEEAYYSWKDVPDEYKKYLIIPQSFSEELSLYNIKVHHDPTYDTLQICYLDNEAKHGLNIEIVINQNQDFTFGNLMYEEGFEFLESSNVEDITVYYYIYEKEDVFAQFVKAKSYYTFSGNMDLEVMQKIVEETIKYNF